ncbi:MAG: SpoIVB peptidase S55 domain-containing protein, partial [Acidobacteriota bacterium]|nr:SpoIVB peptidase S55 domain-containing protein [Acidobacteriota bacterium]
MAIALLGVLLSAAPASAQDGQAALAPTIGVEEIQRGQRGYGLSVFAGSEVERFEVEVLGVLRGSSPGSTAILARLSGQNLEHSGVIAGMSGSPVYIDGRLAGAVAFGWNFSKDPIAGITPIAEMRELGAAMPKGEPQTMRTPLGLLSDGNQKVDQKVGPPSGKPVVRGSASGPVASLKQWLNGEVGEEILAAELAKLVPKMADEASSGLLWTASGFGETSRGLLQSGLGRIASSGVMSGEAAELADWELAPGSPVAAVLIRGDLSLAATGTVTDRQGEQILAFGHPFLGFGPVDMPMAAAEVITVIPSLSNSFKLTNLGPVVGAFREDRSVGMLGRTGDQARLIPTTLRISGDGVIGPREFQLEVARLPQIT